MILIAHQSIEAARESAKALKALGGPVAHQVLRPATQCGMTTEIFGMSDKLLTPLVGILTGAAGYWLTTFCMKPILQYREIRSKVLSDLIFYAQVINADGLNDEMKKRYNDRQDANRRRSAELSACLLDLPRAYIWWLNRRGQDPESAATNLIGLSNTSEYEKAQARVDKIKRQLGIRFENV